MVVTPFGDPAMKMKQQLDPDSGHKGFEMGDAIDFVYGTYETPRIGSVSWGFQRRLATPKAASPPIPTNTLETLLSYDPSAEYVDGLSDLRDSAFSPQGGRLTPNLMTVSVEESPARQAKAM